MKVIAHIKRLSDSEIAVHEQIWEPSVQGPYEPSDAEFMWSDGNYACNCNRTLFFARARGLSEPVELICGRDWFHVRVWADGELVVDEW